MALVKSENPCENHVHNLLAVFNHFNSNVKLIYGAVNEATLLEKFHFYSGKIGKHRNMYYLIMMQSRL